MTKQQRKTYLEKRTELKRKIDYHESQARYHRATRAALENELQALDRMNPTHFDALISQRTTTNQQQIDRANREAALDKEELKNRINKRKADSLLSIMMKNFA